MVVRFGYERYALSVQSPERGVFRAGGRRLQVRRESPSDEERPTRRAELRIETELAWSGDPTDIQQPTWRAELTIKLVPFDPQDAA
jgi:hypothetical protein